MDEKGDAVSGRKYTILVSVDRRAHDTMPSGLDSTISEALEQVGDVDEHRPWNRWSSDKVPIVPRVYLQTPHTVLEQERTEAKVSVGVDAGVAGGLDHLSLNLRIV